MILTAHQPAYLPWLGYFNKIALADAFVIFDNVQFERKSFINRNKVKTSSGEIWLTVPLEITGNFCSNINEMKIKQNDSWYKKHYRSLLVSYKKAPYFEEHIHFFEEFYNLETNNLCELLKYQFEYFIDVLGIKTKVFLLSDLNLEGKKQELILNLCNYFHADKYIFGKLGADYADPKYFADNGVDICFQDYKHPIYRQLWGEFVPYMSVVDLLFNEGKDKAMDIIMQGESK